MKNLKKILKGKVVFLCIGSRERGDDGVGPFLADSLKDKTPYDIIDAGVAPENHTGVVTRLKPDTIIIVDAVCFDGKPGEVRIFSGENLREGKISTHDSSPKLLIEYLKASTNAEIHIIGIRPKSNVLGTELSEEVRESVIKLSEYLV